MKKITGILLIQVGLFHLLAQGQVVPYGHRYIMHDPASVKIPLGQGTIKPVTDAIKGQTDKLKVDLAKVDKAIQDWFDKKKSDPSFYNPLAIQWNTYIEDSKAKAAEAVKEIEDQWNTKVGKLESEVNSSYKAFVDGGPKGLIQGNYGYYENFKDPGDPGWTLQDKITILPIESVGGDASGGLGPVEIKASIGAVVAGGEVVTTVESKAKLSITLKLPDDTKPDAANPLNRPKARTGFIPILKGKLEISFETTAMINAGAGLKIDSNVDFPRASDEIEAGKDLPE